MRINTTIDELIAAFAPGIRRIPAGKPRDPVERELLKGLGDRAVELELDDPVRTAGARLRPPDPQRNPR